MTLKSDNFFKFLNAILLRICPLKYPPAVHKAQNEVNWYFIFVLYAIFSDVYGLGKKLQSTGIKYCKNSTKTRCSFICFSVKKIS